ncbi:MAG: hypothetical protein Q9201_003889 [Fulgogasparrea decipioides]
MVLQAIKYSYGQLEVLDQLQLPHQEIYIKIKNGEDAWHAIKSMQVRGAPAIAIVAALAVAVDATRHFGDLSKALSAKEAAQHIYSQLAYLVTSRPTAVNLADAATKLMTIAEKASKSPNATGDVVIEAYIQAAERMLEDDVQDNERIGEHGAAWIVKNKPQSPADAKISVITHCNTGSLATAGYGTALGVIRSLHAGRSLRHVFYTETRPYNQGSRLTGYELIHDGIPATLITDSMAAALLNTRGHSENIAAIVVGADRVAANGDTANKIGTYALAVLARYHGVKFLVAAPRTTVDMATKTGAEIEIEERPEIEVLNIAGPPINRNQFGEQGLAPDKRETICVAAQHTRAWNPAFDVTPAELIDGIVTEKGVVEKDEHGTFQWRKFFVAGVEDVPAVDEPKPLNMTADGITATESATTAAA